jgi:thioredoxin 1
LFPARCLEVQGEPRKFTIQRCCTTFLFLELLMSDSVIHATESDFDSQVLASDVPVLVDFWAPWCGPCKMIAPALDQIASEYAGKAKVVKVNVDENQQTALKYHVRSIPMLLVFKGGQIQATQIGAVGKAQLAQMLDKAL